MVEITDKHYAEDTLGVMEQVNKDTAHRRAPGWAYAQTDDPPETVVEKTFGKPSGTPYRVGHSELGARTVAVWIGEGAPAVEPDGFAAENVTWWDHVKRWFRR